MKNFILSAILAFTAQASFAKSPSQVIELTVTENGFEPSEIKVKPGTHVTLKVTRKTEQTCATDIIMKEKKIKKALPFNKEVTVVVGVLQKGKITFACGMDMISGHIVAE